MFLLLGIVVGGLLGYVAGAKREAPPERRTTVVQHEPPRPDPPPHPEVSNDRGWRSVTPATTVERGAGRITGRVLAPDGTPVPGVLVRATPNDVEPDAVRDLEAEVRAVVERHHRGAEADTDARGAYVLAGLFDVPHTVHASLDAHVVEPAGGKAPEVRPGAQVDFVAYEAVSLRFDVIFPDGSRPGRATIVCDRHGYQHGSKSRERWSPSEPVIALPPGTYTFSGEGPDPDTHRSEEVEREVATAGSVDAVVLRLESRPGIRGYVRLDPDARFPYVTVRALRQVADAVPDVRRLAQDGKRARVAPGRGNAYVHADLEPGRYVVGVDLGERNIVAMKTVDVGATMVICDFDVSDVDPEHYVVVRVYDPEGNILRDVKLRAGVRGARSGSSGSASTVRRPDGSFLVLHEGRHRYEEATQYVTAVSDRYGARQESYEIGERNEIEIRFGEAATVDFTIAGYDDARHGGIFELKLLSKSSRGFLMPDAEAEPDARGRVTLGPVEAGPADVLLRAEVLERRRRVVLREKLQLGPGENAVTLALPDLYTLTLVADGLEAKTQFGLYRLEGRASTVGWTAVGDDRRITYRNLTAGLYEIRSGDREAMTVRLPGPDVVRWRPQDRNAFRVLIREADGALARLGLQEGDVVVAIGGERIESGDHGELLLKGAAVKESVTLTIRRGTRTLELSVGGKALADAAEGRSGSLHPVPR